ncbi:MarR family winged helix-turn-helix transcriptional regulator [Ornithinimicrobium cavernae]|uniref:MarR family winged helix-turn-helix transcriptional regulator n=1 Tax=Ornithinimicrobium cavernae TaxID=2666047 RepID=UPI000D69AC61|nr:MarR family winged helix-turn-helix transcriptional regulator [Ornithinimicrobium cavernae]
MVDGRDTPGRPAYELALLLLGAFERLTDGVHARLAQEGHPGVTSTHGFAMQAVGSGATTRDVAATLGVSKQAAAKTVERLIDMGYLEAHVDPRDARARILTHTDRGRDMLRRSEHAFEVLRSTWAGLIGPDNLTALEDSLALLNEHELGPSREGGVLGAG